MAQIMLRVASLVSVFLLVAPAHTAALSVKSALLVIDMQGCFGPGGSLSVAGADTIVPVINALRRSGRFDVTAFTQDWHCPNHISFASTHPGKRPFESITLNYTSDGRVCGYGAEYPEVGAECMAEEVSYSLEQTLWPDHCVAHRADAGLLEGVESDPTKDLFIRKGYHCHVDSYSGFADNGHFTQTSLDVELRARGVEHVAITGVAADYCCYYTALDAVRLGYEVTYIVDATRGIDQAGVDRALKVMEDLGVKIVQSADLLAADGVAADGGQPQGHTEL